MMASGGRVGFEAVAWFNGGLFDDGATLPLERSDIETVLAASDLDWSEIDPSLLGTLFERVVVVLPFGTMPNPVVVDGSHASMLTIARRQPRLTGSLRGHRVLPIAFIGQSRVNQLPDVLHGCWDRRTLNASAQIVTVESPERRIEPM